ncbi:MFS transporter [Priestia filamentosa]|uniref:MFS transporter n=1 Tax=Priestia filamentosa TaxID=1402861 RepID=A0A0H4KC12_9BACI|nr:MFS transporter [Priestia filamentosa]AKO91642.1 MFS transporter [Priestia filamentosa]
MQRKIGLSHQLAYGSANLLGSGALAISGAWLMYFYTTFCGLSIIQAAAIFSIASVVDAVSNPVMGFITDNFHKTRLGKRFGRRKFFILLGIPLMLVYPMLWVEGFGFWYYLLTYILFELIYTSVMVPYETIAAEMTTDFGLRSKLTGFKAIFGKIANFLAAFIPGRFIAEYGQDSPLPFFYTGLLYGGIMVIALISLYIFSWERSANEIKDERTGSLWESLKKLFIDMISTFRVRTFRHHLGMYLFGFGAEWLFASAFTYFIVFGLGQSSELVSNLLSFSSIMQLISTAFFIWLCVKMGFARPFRIALNVVILSVIGYTALYFTGSENLVILLFAITMFFGLGTGGVFYIPWNVYTFLADVDEAVTGRRREGLYAGVMTFAGKLTRAVVVYILGWVLGKFGFVSGQSTQPEEAVQAVVGVFAIGVICLAIGGVISAYKLKLNRESHGILIKEIDRINSGGSMKEVDNKTRTVVEALTGFPYEKCFGNNNVGYQQKPNIDSSLKA